MKFNDLLFTLIAYLGAWFLSIVTVLGLMKLLLFCFGW